MQFNFSLTCEQTDTITQSDGVEESACLTEVRGSPTLSTSDLAPETITSLTIYELDHSFQILSEHSYVGPFVDGYSFTHSTSFNNLNTTSLDATSTLPPVGGIQMVAIGVTEDEQPIVNTIILLFTDDCSVFPSDVEGQSLGWVTFVSTIDASFTTNSHNPTLSQAELGHPQVGLCPVSSGQNGKV